ncbi:iron-containing alcohol dehydrogenase family protein [Micromonospora sp. NPDC005087]|uniref:iron-containing alcohol dehydrogenase family protein n=1 Tax=Micromonospora sp. NPDC005087 TaxID=3364225 RepID=UPI0036AE50C8
MDELLGGADFLAPRQVLTGAGCAAGVGAALREWGAEQGRVLVVADRVVADAGLLASLTAGLTEAGLEPVLCAEIAGEPDADLVRRVTETGTSADANAVVGIGGGSAMDVAKLVALLLTNGGDVADQLGLVVPRRPVAPLALVPTTVGTGAEATRIAMVSVAGHKRISSCRQYVPLVAALDPALVSALPAAVVASTGMDALAHALESMLSSNRNALTVTVATRAADLVLANIERATDPDGYEARGRMMLGAYLAGLALNAGVVLGHSLAYVIAGRTALPHGTTCALALPYCLAYNRSADPALLSRVAAAATRGASTDLADAVTAIDALAGRLGLPRSLAAVHIDAAAVPAMAAECVKDYPRPTNPVPLDEERLTRLIGAMHRGDALGAYAGS